jgi:hypothetical protein
MSSKRIFGRHGFVVYGREDGSVVFSVHDAFARAVESDLTPGDAEKLKVSLATWLKGTKRRQGSTTSRLKKGK